MKKKQQQIQKPLKKASISQSSEIDSPCFRRSNQTKNLSRKKNNSNMSFINNIQKIKSQDNQNSNSFQSSSSSLFVYNYQGFLSKKNTQYFSSNNDNINQISSQYSSRPRNGSINSEPQNKSLASNESKNVNQNSYFLTILKKTYAHIPNQINEYIEAVKLVCQKISLQQSQNYLERKNIEVYKNSFERYIKDIQKNLLESIKPFNKSYAKRQKQLQIKQMQFKEVSNFIIDKIYQQISTIESFQQPEQLFSAKGLCFILQFYLQKNKQKEQQSNLLIKQLQQQLYSKNNKKRVHKASTKIKHQQDIANINTVKDKNLQKINNFGSSISIDNDFMISIEQPKTNIQSQKQQKQKDSLLRQNQLLRREISILHQKKQEMETVITYLKSKNKQYEESSFYSNNHNRNSRESKNQNNNDESFDKDKYINQKNNDSKNLLKHLRNNKNSSFDKISGTYIKASTLKNNNWNDTKKKIENICSQKTDLQFLKKQLQQSKISQKTNKEKSIKKIQQLQITIINKNGVINSLQKQINQIKQETQNRYEEIVDQIKRSYEEQIFILQKDLQIYQDQIQKLKLQQKINYNFDNRQITINEKKLENQKLDKLQIQSIDDKTTQEIKKNQFIKNSDNKTQIQINKIMKYVQKIKKELQNVYHKSQFKIKQLNNQLVKYKNTFQYFGIKLNQILMMFGKSGEHLEYIDDCKKMEWVVNLIKEQHTNDINLNTLLLENNHSPFFQNKNSQNHENIVKNRNKNVNFIKDSPEKSSGSEMSMKSLPNSNNFIISFNQKAGNLNNRNNQKLSSNFGSARQSKKITQQQLLIKKPKSPQILAKKQEKQSKTKINKITDFLQANKHRIEKQQKLKKSYHLKQTSKTNQKFYQNTTHQTKKISSPLNDLMFKQQIKKINNFDSNLPSPFDSQTYSTDLQNQPQQYLRESQNQILDKKDFTNNFPSSFESQAFKINKNFDEQILTPIEQCQQQGNTVLFKNFSLNNNISNIKQQNTYNTQGFTNSIEKSKDYDKIQGFYESKAGFLKIKANLLNSSDFVFYK